LKGLFKIHSAAKVGNCRQGAAKNSPINARKIARFIALLFALLGTCQRGTIIILKNGNYGKLKKK